MKKIDNINMISTKKGDSGTSRNYSNKVLPKSDLLFDTLGDLDELTSYFGLVYHRSTFKEEIRLIQQVIQKINSMIATDDHSKLKESSLVTNSDVLFIEEWSERLLRYTDILPVFVLPGSDTSLEGAYFDILRSLARRSERSLVKLYESNPRSELEICLQYLNRLSDLLFVIARYKK